MPLDTVEWNIQDQIKTPESRAAYLEAAFEDGDPQVIATALGDVAKAVGMTEISRQTGLTRNSLYKALSSSGNPTLDTMTKILNSLDLKLTVSSNA